MSLGLSCSLVISPRRLAAGGNAFANAAGAAFGRVANTNVNAAAQTIGQSANRMASHTHSHMHACPAEIRLLHKLQEFTGAGFEFICCWLSKARQSIEIWFFPRCLLASFFPGRTCKVPDCAHSVMQSPVPRWMRQPTPCPPRSPQARVTRPGPRLRQLPPPSPPTAARACSPCWQARHHPEISLPPAC